MVIHTLHALKDNFIYVLANDARECVVIDPGEASIVRKFLDRTCLRLAAILCTHHHHDHVGGVEQLASESGCEVWCSTYDKGRIAGATRAVSESDDLQLLGLPVRILEVPGHTLGQIAFHFPRQSALFTGDTLFSCGCGRLFEGTPAQMFESLQKIKRLPAATQIYFGHEYTLRNIEFIKHEVGRASEDLFDFEQRCRETLARGEPTSPTTLAQELKVNPFVFSDDLATFTKWREARNHW